MDRLMKTFAGFGLALVATAAGCKTAHDEVPPGRAFRNDGRGDRATGAEFGSQPHPSQASALGGQIGGAPGNLTSGPIIQPPPGDAYGATSDGKFGGPGTAGLGTPPALNSTGSYPPRPPIDRGAISEKSVPPNMN